MDPDEASRLCDELHRCMNQAPADRRQGKWDTDDWRQARQDFLADIARLDDAWEHPDRDL